MARRALPLQLCLTALYRGFSGSKQRNASSHKSRANAKCLGTPSPMDTAPGGPTCCYTLAISGSLTCNCLIQRAPIVSPPSPNECGSPWHFPAPILLGSRPHECMRGPPRVAYSYGVGGSHQVMEPAFCWAGRGSTQLRATGSTQLRATGSTQLGVSREAQARADAEEAASRPSADSGPRQALPSPAVRPPPAVLRD